MRSDNPYVIIDPEGGENKKMLKGFRDFLMRGNVVDLAVGVMIGGAFGAIVKALTDDIISPIIGALGGTPDFSAIKFTINNSDFMVGSFVNAVIAFLITASIIYFFIVIPMNKVMAMGKKKEVKKEPTEKECKECLSVIPVKATRCKFCTAVVA